MKKAERFSGASPGMRCVRIGLTAVILSGLAMGDQPPPGPGVGSAWTSGAKEGLGTSTTAGSTVWYTLGRGILNEVYYPSVDVPNVQDLQLIVTSGTSVVDLERDATEHEVQVVDGRALVYRQVNTKPGAYRITKTYVTDPDRPTVLINARFETLGPDACQLFVLYNPSLDNTGSGDSGETSGKALVARDGGVASALVCAPDFTRLSSGYSGTESDGYVDLQRNHRLTNEYDSTDAGNLVQIGQIPDATNDFTLALAFGGTRQEAMENARASISAGFPAIEAKYRKGWHDYLASLKPKPSCISTGELEKQYNVALMVLKAHQDKTNPGASVASLSVPWGDIVDAGSAKPGYHRVWARDLYQVATAQAAAGDERSALAALTFLLDKQRLQQATSSGGQTLNPGSFPRYSKTTGSASGDLSCCEQLDEDAFPLVLAWQLGQRDAATWSKLRPTAENILDKGPTTPSDRWEEVGGYSPSTLAAAIAGLLCAADIARANGAGGDADRYEEKADEWRSKIEDWTYTTTGYFGDHSYYERIDTTGDPNDQQQLQFGNERFWERDVVDMSFLELVRLGVKPANDPKIVRSLEVVDSRIKVTTPDGEMWYRYNHDRYGEDDVTGTGWVDRKDANTRGRLWPLLCGERGEYELAIGRVDLATERLRTMARAANRGYLIPEQVWDGSDRFGFKFGQGTGSATPLAWAMAQFVRLAISIDNGCPIETPKVVADRYGTACSRKLVDVTFTVQVPPGTEATGKSVFIAGELDRLDPSLPLWNPSATRLARVDPTHWKITLKAPEGVQVQYKYTLGEWLFVEKGAGCAEIPNRKVTVGGSGGSQSVDDTVLNWRSLAGCR